MWLAIIPAFNEAESINNVIQSLVNIDIDNIILVANGCTDNTINIAANSCCNKRLMILNFHIALGIDIPRAIGAVFAKTFNPKGIIFIDGDMDGLITNCLINLKKSIDSGIDMALTNCYPYINTRTDLAISVLKEREKLNRKLGVFNTIGLATPSHGPHAISSKLLLNIPPKIIAIPPLSLSYTIKNGFKVEVAAAISHNLLGSNLRNNTHADMIAQTIKGDCCQAMQYVNGVPLEIVFNDYKNCLMGYRNLRRFDLLENFIRNIYIYKRAGVFI